MQPLSILPPPLWAVISATAVHSACNVQQPDANWLPYFTWMGPTGSHMINEETKQLKLFIKSINTKHIPYKKSKSCQQI